MGLTRAQEIDNAIELAWAEYLRLIQDRRRSAGLTRCKAAWWAHDKYGVPFDTILDAIEKRDRKRMADV